MYFLLGSSVFLMAMHAAIVLAIGVRVVMQPERRGVYASMAAAGGDAAVFRRAGVSAHRRAPDRAQAYTRHYCIAHRFPPDRESHHSRRFHRRHLAGPSGDGAGDGPPGEIAGRFRHRSRQHFRTLYRHPGDSRGDCPRCRCSKNQRADGVLYLERRWGGRRSCRSGHSCCRSRRALPAADRRSGARPWWKGPQPKRLRDAGVQLRAALPVGLLRTLVGRTDLRLHRKIVVIDGMAAWTGSMN